MLQPKSGNKYESIIFMEFKIQNKFESKGSSF